MALCADLETLGKSTFCDVDAPRMAAASMLNPVVLQRNRLCADRSQECAAWRDAGECEANAEYMEDHCCASCNVGGAPASLAREIAAFICSKAPGSERIMCTCRVETRGIHQPGKGLWRARQHSF